MNLTKPLVILGLMSLALLPLQNAHTEDNTHYWMKLRAKDKFERTLISNTGVVIDSVREDFVAVVANSTEKKVLEDMGVVEVSFPLTAEMDFPVKDGAFHNYKEMTDRLQALTNQHSGISRMESIGKTVEGRDIWNVRISGDLAHADTLPAIVFMGGHHAREHLSIELPIYYIEYLLTEYATGNPRIQRLLNGRDINFIPSVNPDGSEYDIASGSYQSWRKNRTRNANGTVGVDLNRNYSYGWGGQGASTSPSSDTYRGTSAFSEPETQAIKRFIEERENITVLLSFHTYSELILYPFGHTYNPISDAKDRQVHEVMAKKMATWNGYKPQQSAALYLASGDTTDWSYGEHKIISFTFELDPADAWGNGGFYPGADVIPVVQRKNLEPVLYLIEYSDNPYRALETNGPILRP